MIHIVFHGVQCTTLYCTLAYLMMGSSDLSTIINHQPQPQSEHQHLYYHHHQGLSSVHTCCRHMTSFLCQLMTTSPIQMIIIGIALSSLCLIRIVYSYTLLSEVSSSSSISVRLSSTGGEKLTYADNKYEQMGLLSWIYLKSMFVLFNVAVMRWSARTSMTTSRSLLGDRWMDGWLSFIYHRL